LHNGSNGSAEGRRGAYGRLCVCGECGTLGDCDCRGPPPRWCSWDGFAWTMSADVSPISGPKLLGRRVEALPKLQGLREVQCISRLKTLHA
jgi:hypothetical protein